MLVYSHLPDLVLRIVADSLLHFPVLVLLEDHPIFIELKQFVKSEEFCDVLVGEQLFPGSCIAV